MHYVKNPAIRISIALVSLMAFILIAVVYKNSADIKMLKAKNAKLRAEILKKDNQLKSEREELYNRSHSFTEASTSPKTIEPVARPIQIRYRHRSQHCRYRQHHRRHRRNRLERNPEVSRGDARTIDVETTIRVAGSEYWADPNELDALVWISNHECTTPGGVNPRGYYGLFQLSNPPAWMILGDAASETKAGCEYILRRYGTPLAAKAWWERHHWY